MVIFPALLILQLLTIPIYSLSSEKYVQIQEFEKVEVQEVTSFYQFNSTLKENGEYINSDLLINIENNNLNNEIYLDVCL